MKIDRRQSGIAEIRSGKTLAARLDFYSMPEPNSGCLLWIGAVDLRGYGALNYKGRVIKAHRAAYGLAFGEPPRHLHVCHKCDVPACINPAHLWLGTDADNVRDMIVKGRRKLVVPYGESHGMSKINADIVRQMRRDSRPIADIAKNFGVSKSLVSQVQRRAIWRHVI